MWVLGHIAKQVITVSQFSKKELAHYLNIDQEKIATISEGCEHILNDVPDDSILKNNNLIKTPFFLITGSSSPHKNLENVIKAIERYSNNSIRLVVAGGNYSKVFAKVSKSESKRIKYLGYVADSELRSLYSHATSFIFPSFYEGFGLPPLEAMICGCPVICSNMASIPEICGEAALYFDPFDVQEIGKRIEQLMGSDSLRGSLKQRGLLRAEQFTWEKSAKIFLSILRKNLLILS
jgi:glycosyltransferase involved in cell wall biosynthesis